MRLGTGISFSHFLRWRMKAELPGEVFVRVQKTLYNDYGPTGAIVEPGELLSALATLALVRKRRIQTVLASVSLLTVLAKLPVWALFIRPINEQTLDWEELSLPPNREEFRDRWHRLHLLRFVLWALGTSSLLISLSPILGARNIRRGSFPSVPDPIRSGANAGNREPGNQI